MTQAEKNYFLIKKRKEFLKKCAPEQSSFVTEKK